MRKTNAQLEKELNDIKTAVKTSLESFYEEGLNEHLCIDGERKLEVLKQLVGFSTKKDYRLELQLSDVESEDLDCDDLEISIKFKGKEIYFDIHDCYLN